MNRRVLDLFCGAGGAGMGYANAGFEVVGVDVEPQPHYPFEFHLGDAMEWDFEGFDLVHASPPCQAYSWASVKWRHKGKVYPDLIGPLREKLTAWGGPWVIENVRAAPLLQPTVLCGTMFGLRLYRHRYFETSPRVLVPPHRPHREVVEKMGRHYSDGSGFVHVVGHFSGVDYARKVMGIPWMTRDELSQAVPPAYTERLGKNLLRPLYPSGRNEASPAGQTG